MSRNEGHVQGRWSRALLWAFASLLTLSLALVAESAERPDPLEPEKGCQLWVGEAVGGNDPTVQVQIRLCQVDGGAEVAGVVQWSSLLSGWNLRELAGAWSSTGDTLSLRDVVILEERPEPGWYFCTIDLYDLHMADMNRLEGTYSSAACQDTANLTLWLQVEESSE